MSGIRVKLPGTFTDTSLPKLRLDPVLPDAGALLLLEPGSPINPVVGVPVDATKWPNIAADQARALTGLPSATDLDVGALWALTSFASPYGAIERTTKGGVHVVPSQASGMVDGHNARLVLSDNLKTYLVANPTHSLYVDLAYMLTRPGLSGATTSILRKFAMVSTTSPSSNYLAQIWNLANATGPTNEANSSLGYTPSTYPSASVGATKFLASTLVGGGAAIAPKRASLAVSGWNGTAPTTIATLTSRLGWGPSSMGSMANDGNTGSGDPKIYPSWALYWLYIEDLTVSGRSFATVDALSAAKYAKEVTTSGGRYYADTYTAPATLMP